MTNGVAGTPTMFVDGKRYDRRGPSRTCSRRPSTPRSRCHSFRLCLNWALFLRRARCRAPGTR
ncbi:hypothetical protein QJS66_09310 [Kocuria rhizophila]|nr:hypothetical protein QJS66_09310 [Kocuria rhizophila]